MSHSVIGMTGLGTIGKQIQAAGVPVSCLGFTRGSVSLSGLIKLFRMLRKINPDVIQTWMYHANVLGLLTGKLVTKAQIAWNIRASVRQLSEYKPLTVATLYLGRLLSKIPDAVVFNSQTGIRDHLKWGYRPKKACYIPNGFDLDLFQPDQSFRHELRERLSIGEHAFCVGFIGRFEPVKDYRTFFEAAGRMHQEQRDTHFILCGEIEEKNRPVVEAWTHEFDLESCIHLLGARKNIYQIMPAMDIFVSSSKSEGFSNVIGEAMACGVPCVVTDVGDSPMIVGQTGRVVLPKDPGAIAKAVLEVRQMSDEERGSLSVCARQRIKADYSIEKIAKVYERLYQTMSG